MDSIPRSAAVALALALATCSGEVGPGSVLRDDGGEPGPTDAAVPPPGVLPSPRADGDVLDLGSLPRLLFTVAGDVRPVDPGGPYPEQIITRILRLADARAPDLGLLLGDYMYVYPASYPQAAGQIQILRRALGGFRQTTYFVLGNHEAPFDNLRAFRDLLSPSTYFALRATTPQGTVKIVFLANNLWDAAQQQWAADRLSEPTTYTFVARHHPMSDSTGSNRQIASFLRGYPYTLILAGHSHIYDRRTKEVIFGNAGAPLSGGGQQYGYGTVEILGSGEVRVRSYRQDSDALVDDFTVSP